MTNQPRIELFDDPEVGYRLKAFMQVSCPIDEVFRFFADAGNLERITPPWLNFQILTPMPVEITKGSLLDYKIRLHCIPIKWRTEICDWHPPYKFTDQQLRGPYKKWFHEHTFEDAGNGVTNVIDDVHYIPRGGSLVHRLLVKPDLAKIFQYRQDQLVQIFAKPQQIADSPLSCEMRLQPSG
jgi:ligand-binding SRPBCC domain-containing protein